MNKVLNQRESERGSAGVKFAAFMAALLLAAHAGFNYVPVAYDAESLKSDMSTAVVQGLATPGKLSPADNVKARIVRSAQANNIPPDFLIDVKMAPGNVVTAHVSYTQPVNILPFGIYKYNYRFDHTATPTGFLLKQ